MWSVGQYVKYSRTECIKYSRSLDGVIKVPRWVITIIMKVTMLVSVDFSEWSVRNLFHISKWPYGTN